MTDPAPAAAPAATAPETSERRNPTVMFNIPEPNPLRGQNILIEMNSAAARLLCNVLDDIDLNRPEDKPLIAFKKTIRRYYGQLAENRRSRDAVSPGVLSFVPDPALTPNSP